MNKLPITLLLFGLIPFGAGLLVLAIHILRRTLSGNVLAELSLTGKSTDFRIAEQGTYAIWQKGPLFSLTPVNQFVPIIVHASSGNRLEIRRTLVGAAMNDGVKARSELFTFWAEAGTYRLIFGNGSSLSALEHWLSKPFRPLLTPVDLGQYVIQVRESQPVYYTCIGSLLILLAGICIIGGIISGVLSML